MNGKHRVVALAAASVVVAGGVVQAVGPAGASEVGCRIDYAVSSEWTGGFSATVRLTNLGSPLTGWVLGFDFPAGQQVAQVWSAIWVQSGAHVTAANAAWNGSLGTGASADMGFTGSWTGSNPAPTAFTLNGLPCDGALHGPSAPPATPSTEPASPSTGPSASTSPGDLPPVVKLTSPNGTSIYGEPGTIQLSATASDPDGVVTKVEFSTAPLGGTPFTLVATVTTAPYSYRLTVPAANVFVIQAKAYDDAGRTATDTVRIHVAVSDPPPPSRSPSPN